MGIMLSAKIILGIVIIWIFLDYLFGKINHVKKSDRKEYQIRNNCDFEIFYHGADLFENLFRDIKNARKHVHVLFYIVKDDGFSKEFFSILKAKAREGVEVRLLVDRVGSYKISKNIVSDLKAANVQIAFSRVPKFPFLLFSTQVRNHRKISVIDGKVGYVGGFNVGNEYIDLDPKLSPWRDYHLKLTGAIVLDLQKTFLEDWQSAAKLKFHDITAYLPDLTENSQGEMAIQAVSSEGAFVEDLFANRIQNAKKSIFIGTPYFIPSKLLFSELMKALKRGIKITILVPHVSDHPLVKEASFRYLRPLIKAGAEVYQFYNGFYHAKVLFFDEEICDIGTANFDQRSLFFNDEINCFIYDKKSIEVIKKVVHKDLTDAKKLTLLDLNQVSLWTKIKEAAARPVSKFL